LAYHDRYEFGDVEEVVDEEAVDDEEVADEMERLKV
jgi:hypothetical protein